MLEVWFAFTLSQFPDAILDDFIRAFIVRFVITSPLFMVRFPEWKLFDVMVFWVSINLVIALVLV